MSDDARSFHARYLAGEHEAVWRELAALGDGVRDPAVIDDARAVARETMRRVRRNVELVVARLHAMGYRFVQPAHEPPTPELLARLDALEAQAGPLPLALRAFYEEVGAVCLMGAHPTLSSYAESPNLGSMLRAVGGALAASLQARMFTPHVDDASRVSRASRTSREAPASDPLVVWAPHDDDVGELRELGDPDDPGARDEEGWTGRYVIDIAPDVFHKANVSGGDAYAIAFPDAGADAPVRELDAPSFVAYLRECFRWGGFPGLADEREPPRADVARLTEGLEAF